MDNAVGTKDEDAVVSTVNQLTKTDEPQFDIENSNIKQSVVDSESAAVVANASDIDTYIRRNSVSIEDDKLNEAMSATTISISDTEEIPQHSVEGSLDEQQKQEKSTTVIKENLITDNKNVHLDTSMKVLGQDDEINSTIGGEFEDAQEFINNEDHIDKEQQQDVNKEECVVSKSCGDEELPNDNDAEEPEEAVVSVPVDDDTNDPQYIPRRGRFYEHDDRMAYSTTSSEGSESGDMYEDDSEDKNEDGSRRRRRRLHTSSKMHKPISVTDSVENTITTDTDSISSAKKVLEISKVAALTLNSLETPTTDAIGISKKPGGSSKKSRNLDSLDKWSHDMYNENEQTPKSKDELLASYGYDIREESEAPRARRHHKYGRAATTKYTRNWQDTKAYTGTGAGQQALKVKRGGIGQRNFGGTNTNKKPINLEEYTSEFPALDNSKPNESSLITDDSVKNHNQQVKSPIQKKIIVTATPNTATPNTSTPNTATPKTATPNAATPNSATPNTATPNTATPKTVTGPPKQHTSISRSFSKTNTSANRNYLQDQQNGGPSSSFNKNLGRPSMDSPDKEKITQINRDSLSTVANPNLYNRKPQQQQISTHNQHNNYKQQHFNSNQGNTSNNMHHQHSPSIVPRGRNFYQLHNNQQHFNRDRYYSKGSAPSSNSNQQNFEPNQNTIISTTAGTGRTQHSGGGQYHHYNNRHFENENQRIEQPAPPPVIRSSKRYSVQSQRELPNPVLNFNTIPKAPQQQPPSVTRQQQNGLVIQDQQQTMQQIQQQQPMQLHQQPPPPMQIQQYHQPLPQIHPHHGMVLDHNTGMMVMAAADPSMYHHQIYAGPQYTTAVTTGPASGGVDDPNAAAAAAALQMLAAQAAVYQPVSTVATGVTPPPSSTQSETFMTTYYQPLQQPQQQPPPRRVNLAIPIVAPPPDPTPQQGAPKNNSSSTPPPTAALAN